MFNQVVLHYKIKHSSNRFSRLVYARNILKKLTVLIGLLVIVITALRLILRRSSTYSIKEPLFVFESSCECRKWEKIVIEDNFENGYSVFSIDSREFINPKRLLYNLNRNELEKSNFTCDLFSEFRRGKDQKVISYNLYGDNTRYYEKIGSIVKQAKELYPDWYIRIYSNGSLNDSFRCMLECSPESNVEVCNVKQLIPDLNHIKKNQIWDATYIMPSMWRYLPMGDSFVNIMISRDSDSYIIQREKDAVDAWLETGLLGHIMRDNLHHKDVMLAGMWGLRMDIDTHQKLVNKWWNKLIDPNHARGYNPHPSNPKESDQIWLKHTVWWHFSRFALIHDSYNCDKLMGGSPWPTRRLGDCFVGATHGCNETAIAAREFECPHICRPGNHRDWNTC